MTNNQLTQERVTRFAHYGTGMMEWPDGGYVKYEDYAALAAELQERREVGSEAVALRWRWNDNDAQWTYAPACKMPEFVAAGFTRENGVQIEYLYTALPALTVPEEITSASAPELFEIAAEAERLGLRGAYASYAVGWNACRAAMLQRKTE